MSREPTGKDFRERWERMSREDRAELHAIVRYDVVKRSRLERVGLFCVGLALAGPGFAILGARWLVRKARGG